MTSSANSSAPIRALRFACGLGCTLAVMLGAGACAQRSSPDGATMPHVEPGTTPPPLPSPPAAPGPAGALPSSSIDASR